MSSYPKKNQWFQPGEGIAREVITADIQRYLGNDALVKPGRGTGQYEGVDGYWITAYRTLTSQMVEDLKLDSSRWHQEVRQGRGSPHMRDSHSSRHPDKVLVKYQESATHLSRQHYGPSTPAPTEYAPQPQYQNYGSTPQQYQQSVPSGYEPAYTHTAPQTQPGYVLQGGQYVPAPPTGTGQIRSQPAQVQYAQYGQPARETESPYGQPGYAYPPSGSAPPTHRGGYAPPPASTNQAYAYDDRQTYQQQPPSQGRHGRR